MGLRGSNAEQNMHLYIPFLLKRLKRQLHVIYFHFGTPRQIKEVVEVDCDRQVGKYGLHDV
jgi:hypothetical protein